MKEKPALESVPQQAVLVAGNALPQYARVINRLSAVITDAGSSAGHLASVAREFQIPALMNTGEASAVLEHGQEVTVHADGRTVYAGSVEQLLASPCARVDLIADSSFMRKMRYIIEFVSPLNLVDPEADSFIPQRCRSFHDIIRFAHERAVQEMFFISRNRLRKLSFAKKLTSEIPMQFYVLDVGGGLQEHAGTGKEIRIEDVQNRAMLALWKGLSHPDIHWGEFSHFDWAAHDKIVMSGGIASPESTMFASHAVISHDYLNLNLRFGYHFVIVDVLLGSGTSEKNILFRFSGGGADIDQRMLRAEFLRRILQRLGFETTVKSDLIDARFEGTALDASLQTLEMLGRLLGATRLMDMYLKDDRMIEGFVDDFMRGRYDFASTD
ncbi:MAG: PEP-utilizing enzyme [Deltaproteobacteria bacterium]